MKRAYTRSRAPAPPLPVAPLCGNKGERCTLGLGTFLIYPIPSLNSLSLQAFKYHSSLDVIMPQWSESIFECLASCFFVHGPGPVQPGLLQVLDISAGNHDPIRILPPG